MRLSRNILIALVVLLAAAGPLASAEKVTLRIDVPPKSLRGMQTAADRAVLDAFLAKHPEVVIDPYVKLRIEGPRGEATIYMSMAGDTAPDALYVYGRSSQKYIDQEFLYPLNEYLIDDNEMLHNEVFLKFLPAISREVPIDDYLRDFKVADPAHFRERLKADECAPLRGENGKVKLVYGLPAMAAVSGLLYRKDLFEEAGLDRPPETWQELLDYARKLTLPERGQFGMMLPGGGGAGWRFANFVWQAGGNVCERGPDGRWRLALDSPEAIEALAFWKELKWGKWTRDGKVLEGCLQVNASRPMQEFVEGRVAMKVESNRGDIGRYLQQGLDPSQVGFAPLPSGPRDPNKPRIHAAMLEGEFWGINNLIAQDLPRRRATWQYIRFLVGKQARRIRTRTYVEAGWAMSVNPKWLKEFGYEAELRQMPPEWITLYDNIVKNTRLEPYARAYAQVSTDVISKIDLILGDRDGDPATVARQMTQIANSRHFATTPPEVLSRQRFWANGIFAVVMAGVGVILAWQFTKWRRRHRERTEIAAELLSGVETPGKRRMRLRMEIVAWLFMFPAVLTILIWKYYPLLRGAVLAFMDYRIIGKSSFVWLDNFRDAFTSPPFWRSFAQTGIYAGMSLSIGFLMPIFLALVLSEIPRFKMFFRTVFYLPAITSGLVVMFIWKMMYHNSKQGIFNRGLFWLTGGTPGRTLLILLFLGAWTLFLAMALGIVARIMHHSRGRALALIVVFLIIAAPFWVDAVAEFVGLVGLTDAQWVADVPKLAEDAGWVEEADAGVRNTLGWITHWPERAGFSLTLTFLFQGMLRGGVVLLTTAGVLMLLKRRGETSGRTVFLVSATSLVVMGAALGVRLNVLLPVLTKPYQWLHDATGYWAMLWVIVPGIWARMGPGCIIYLAALKSIPEDLYEAADVDGAGSIEKAYHVTFQYLKPLIIINFVGAFVGTFHAMQNILVMTGGGPSEKTMTIGMDIFFNAFTHLKFGYATAEAWILGSLLIGFTLYQLRILKKLRFTRAQN